MDSQLAPGSEEECLAGLGLALLGGGAAGGSQRRKAEVSRGEKQHPPVGLLAGRGPGRQVIRS